MEYIIGIKKSIEAIFNMQAYREEMSKGQKGML